MRLNDLLREIQYTRLVLPKDEVVVVRNDEVVGVGKAVLTGREMVELRNGIGVKIRHRKKN